MLRSVGNAQAVDPGFETKDVVMLGTHLGLHGYDKKTGRVFYAPLELIALELIAGRDRSSAIRGGGVRAHRGPKKAR